MYIMDVKCCFFFIEYTVVPENKACWIVSDTSIKVFKHIGLGMVMHWMVKHKTNSQNDFKAGERQTVK